jgi:hypothetical protein
MNVRATALLVRRLVALTVLVGLWEVLARFGVINPFYVPPPSKVAATLFTLFADGEIWTHIEATFDAALLGLALVLLCHKLRRERPFVFAPQHGQRDKMATSLAMSRRRKVEIELGT